MKLQRSGTCMEAEEAAGDTVEAAGQDVDAWLDWWDWLLVP